MYLTSHLLDTTIHDLLNVENHCSKYGVFKLNFSARVFCDFISDSFFSDSYLNILYCIITMFS